VTEFVHPERLGRQEKISRTFCVKANHESLTIDRLTSQVGERYNALGKEGVTVHNSIYSLHYYCAQIYSSSMIISSLA